MNSQNTHKYWGSFLDLKLDSSEFYDYEIDKTQNDYNSDVIDFNNPITYDSLVFTSTALADTQCVRETVTLVEIDLSSQIPNSVFLGQEYVVDYLDFTTYYNHEDTVLNGYVYERVLSGPTRHFFVISKFNDGLPNMVLENTADTYGWLKPYYSCTYDAIGITSTNSSTCCPIDPVKDAKPWAYKFDHGTGSDRCSNFLKRRPESGWTIDLVFSRLKEVNGEMILQPWTEGKTFYYWGVRGENAIANYADNNLSFSFTGDGRIVWRKIHYSGTCTDDGVWTEGYYTITGQTPILCDSGTSDDFNITITFDRYKHYENCELENDGGWNDMVLGNYVIPYSDPDYDTVTSTQIVVNSSSEALTKKWALERQRRLGVLKIYLNGRPIYKVDNWEEVIPSNETRGNQPFIQMWGGGSIYSGGIHNDGISCFNMKRIKYFEEPLNYVNVRHHYLVSTKPSYSIVECADTCPDTVTGGVGGASNNDLGYLFIPNGDLEYLLIPDNDIIVEFI